MATVFLTSNTSWYLYNFRCNTIKTFLSKGYRVICLSPPDDHSRLLEEIGAEYIPLGLDGKSTNLGAEIASLLCIRRAIQAYRPDYVFNFTIKMNLYSGLLCKIYGIPFSNNVSGLGTAFIHDDVLFRVVRWFYGRVNRFAEHVFFQNEDDRVVFERKCRLPGASVTVLPGSGVDLDHFTLRPLPDVDGVTFLMIARLLGDKGVREYASACARLRLEVPGVRCLLLGPPGASNRTAISMDEVEYWVAEGFLEYLGQSEDVRAVIAEAHVLVLPSYREGMPRTVLEAAAMGRPAIVSDVPGCRQAVEPEVTGWFCEPRDADSLFGAMRRLTIMPYEQLLAAGTRARERMEAHFSEALVICAYLQRIEHLNRTGSRATK